MIAKQSTSQSGEETTLQGDEGKDMKNTSAEHVHHVRREISLVVREDECKGSIHEINVTHFLASVALIGW